MKIAIIGIKGIPAQYGGFETCVEETSKRLVKCGLQIVVYCRKTLYNERPKKYEGITLKYVNSINTKSLFTITSSFLSVLDILFSDIKIVHIYVSGNSIFIPLLKIFGKKCLISVDALDWKRKKWGKISSSYIKLSEWISVKFADSIFSDSITVCDYYKVKYKRTIDYIPFWANLDHNKSDNVILKYGLIPKKYFIFVGIFRSEKNVDLLIRSFNKAETKDFKLLLLGDDPINPEYVQYLKSLKTDKIVFGGRIYGEEYESISYHAYAYVSASEVEGTSPALVAAMGFKLAVLVSNIPENLETINNCGEVFDVNCEKSLQEKFELLINNPVYVKELSEKSYKLVKEKYSWDKVAQDLLNFYTKYS